MIKQTPFLLRMIGYPPYRRWVALVHVGGDHSHWEYFVQRPPLSQGAATMNESRIELQSIAKEQP